MRRPQTTGHSDWIWIPYFRRCWVGPDKVEVTHPIVFGRGFFFDRAKQMVTIRRYLFGLPLSTKELPFSDVTVFLGGRYIADTYDEWGSVPGGYRYFIAMTMGRDRPWVKVFEEESLHDRSRAGRILAAIRRVLR